MDAFRQVRRTHRAHRAHRPPIPVLLLTLAVGTACDTSPSDPDGGDAIVFREISVGSAHACGIDSDGRAWCWGDNHMGELGYRGDDTKAPVAVTGGHRWARIEANSGRTCGITDDADLYCWGRLPRYLSDEDMDGDSSWVPLLVDDDREWVDLSLGSFLCALDADGAAWCDGPWPVVEQDDGFAELPGDVTWASISAGDTHACGVADDGTGYCVGSNSYGQLGLDPSGVAGADLPVAIEDAEWNMLRAGFHFTCGVTTADQLFCWGYNESVELGVDGPFETHEPVSPTFQAVHALVVSTGAWDARHVSCARLNAGGWGCWGDGETIVEIAPPAAGPWDFIQAGINQACGLVDGRVWCWGFLWGDESRIVIPDPDETPLPEPA